MEAEKLQDIKLSADWQPAADVTGDFLRTTGKYECLLQEIALEALTQEGDLFYDPGFGWSLIDFIHGDCDELSSLEIQQRVFTKLSWYAEVDANSIKVDLHFQEDVTGIAARFKFVGSNDEYRLQLQLDRIKTEVVFKNA